MKRPLLLAALLAIVTITARAQSKRSRFGIEASAALAFPVGKFGEKDDSFMPFQSEEDPIGAARMGFAFDIKPGYYFTKEARVFLLMGLGWHSRDERSMEKQLRGQYSGSDITVDVKSDDWVLWKLMPGLSYTFEGSNGLKFRPQVAAGVMFTKWPKLEGVTVIGGPFNPNPPTISAFTMAARELPTAFAYQFGATASYPIVKNEVFLNLDLYYFNAGCKENISYFVPAPPNGVRIIETEYNYKFAIINFGAGIEFRF